MALEFASDELKGHKEVVLAAVAQSGRALEYATKDMKGDNVLSLLTPSNAFGTHEGRSMCLPTKRRNKARISWWSRMGKRQACDLATPANESTERHRLQERCHAHLVGS